MLFTRECDYAIRILRVLADEKTHNVPSIAEQADITVAIAYKLTRKLEQGGLIQSFRGARGGYALKVPLDQVTLYDVLSQIDRGIFVTECVADGYICSQNTSIHPCGIHQEFQRLQKMLLEECQSRSLINILGIETKQES